MDAQDLVGLGTDASGQVNPPGGAALGTNSSSQIASPADLGGGAVPTTPAVNASSPEAGASGLSALVSDGTQDYAYLLPGSGQAPLSAYGQSSKATTYLGTDLLGGVLMPQHKDNMLPNTRAEQCGLQAFRLTIKTVNSQLTAMGIGHLHVRYGQPSHSDQWVSSRPPMSET